MMAALQHLIALAGGWQQRPSVRRPAYDSDEIRQLRRQLKALQQLLSLLRCPLPPSSGCWPRSWTILIEQLHSLQLHLPQSSIPELQAAAQEQRLKCANALATLT